MPCPKSLPPEVWNQVIGKIPQLYLPPLLGVSSQFHDITIRFLFSSVKIYFIGGERGQRMLNSFYPDWMNEVARKLMCKSWEILNHICQDPRFARVVKSITVIAYSEGLSVFERMTVANALFFVPNLQTFRWIGDGPSFDDDVAECLPANLKKLVVQSHFPHTSLQHLQMLTTLHLPMPFFFPEDEEAHDQLVLDGEGLENLDYPVDTILETTASELQSLRITATHVHSVPIRVYNQLTNLEIMFTNGDAEELVGLDVVFHHATALESLALVGFIVPELFSFLPHSSVGCLPRLGSFRLSCELAESSHTGTREVTLLCGFLQDRALLRRLCLRVPSISWFDTYKLFFVIKTLEGLEVLGLHTGSNSLEEHEVIELLANNLSPKLHALHLAMNWGGESLLPLVDAISKLPRLTFLHLYSVIGRLPMLLEDLLEANGLQMIGLNRALWTIDRVGPETLTAKWPRWKIKFCIEEDFLCADDAWLFQYN